MARAIKGGEYGANGEWYKGGQFLNTIAENDKREARKQAKRARKVQVEPYKWELEREGMFPIFKMIGVQAKGDGNGNIVPNEPGMRMYGETFNGHKVADLCERFNAGERWAECK